MRFSNILTGMAVAALTSSACASQAISSKMTAGADPGVLYVTFDKPVIEAGKVGKFVTDNPIKFDKVVNYAALWLAPNLLQIFVYDRGADFSKVKWTYGDSLKLAPKDTPNQANWWNTPGLPGLQGRGRWNQAGHNNEVETIPSSVIRNLVYDSNLANIVGAKEFAVCVAYDKRYEGITCVPATVNEVKKRFGGVFASSAELFLKQYGNISDLDVPIPGWYILEADTQGANVEYEDSFYFTDSEYSYRISNEKKRFQATSCHLDVSSSTTADSREGYLVPWDATLKFSHSLMPRDLSKFLESVKFRLDEGATLDFDPEKLRWDSGGEYPEWIIEFDPASATGEKGFNELNLLVYRSTEGLDLEEKITPPDDLILASIKASVDISGEEFKKIDWNGNVWSSAQGSLKGSSSEPIKFRPQNVGIAVKDNTLARDGKRLFCVGGSNYRNLRVRIKKMDGIPAIRVVETYTKRKVPFNLIDGKVVADKVVKDEIELNSLAEVTLSMDELLGHKADPGIYFVEVEGSEGYLDGKNAVSQGIIQLTDLGISCRSSDENTHLAVFSLGSGDLVDAEVTYYGPDGNLLGKGQAKSGQMIIPNSKDLCVIDVRSGDNHYVYNVKRNAHDYDDGYENSDYWKYMRMLEKLNDPCRALVFSDREIYREGEQINLKAYIRSHRNGSEEIEPGEYKIAMMSNDGDEIMSAPFEISAHGSGDVTWTAPAKSGVYSVQILKNTAGVVSNPRSSEYDDFSGGYDYEEYLEFKNSLNKNKFVAQRPKTWQTIGATRIMVSDFKRKSIEMSMDCKAPVVVGKDGGEGDIEFSAKNYSGAKVTGAGQIFVKETSGNFYPDGLSQYLFGNHEDNDRGYWEHYYGWGNYYNPSSNVWQSGTINLSDEGQATGKFKIEAPREPLVRELSVTVRVDDGKGETVSSSKKIKVHPAAVHVGVGRNTRFNDKSKDLELDLVAVDTQGKALQASQKVSVEVSRTDHVAYWNRYGENRKKETETVPEVTKIGDFTIAADSVQNPTRIKVKADKPGVYLVKVSGEDEKGNPVRTIVRHYVYGHEESAIAYRDNSSEIEMASEKPLYKPGETARVLFVEPVEGKVLLTMEREKVMRSTVVEVTADKPWVEIPLLPEDAPNVFITATKVVKLPHESNPKEAVKLISGSCNLIVQPVDKILDVKFADVAKDVQPGSRTELGGVVKDSRGAPVAGAEVLVYAEDEGTLVLASYDDPDPVAFYYEPRRNRIQNSNSLAYLLSEELSDRESLWGNKGEFIGGGDIEPLRAGMQSLHLRQDFNPCAVWAPKLVTDQNGRFNVSFHSPDTLTRYRVLAVAADKTGRFGTSRSSYRVNKEVMLEPSMPEFAYFDDEFTVTATLTNTTAKEGVWKVELSNPDLAFVSLPGDSESRTGSFGAAQEIRLAPNAQVPVKFHLKIRELGQNKISWKATPVSLTENGKTRAPSNSEYQTLSDTFAKNMTTYFPATVRNVSDCKKIGSGEVFSLSKSLQSSGIESATGNAGIVITTSPLASIKSSMDYLLQYPYGCCEQTSSSTLPWILALNMKGVMPSISKHSPDYIMRMIQRGVDRLVSFQTADGGFAYWPGGKVSCGYTPYAMRVLIMARNAGAKVPEPLVERVCEALRISAHKQINNLGAANQHDYYASYLGDPTDICLTLVKAGKTDQSLINRLLSNQDKLFPQNKLQLCLAMAETKDPQNVEAATKLIETVKGGKDYEQSYLTLLGTEAEVALGIDSAISRGVSIIQKSFGERYLSTWSSAQTLSLAARIGNTMKENSATVEVEITYPDRKELVVLDKDKPTLDTAVRISPDSDCQIKVNSGSAYVLAKSTLRPNRIIQKAERGKNAPTISKTCYKLSADGKGWDKVDGKLTVGDTVLVHLGAKRDGQMSSMYSMFQDSLPVAFEALNPALEGQVVATLPQAPVGNAILIQPKALKDSGSTLGSPYWRLDYSEYKYDRVAAFIDYWGGEEVNLYYIARVIRPGRVSLPPFHYEMMYEPEVYATTENSVLDIQPKE